MTQEQSNETVSQVTVTSGNVTETEATQEKAEAVSYDTYRRAISEIKSLKAKLNELKAQREAEEQQRLAEQGRWKEKAELLEKKMAEKDEKIGQLVNRFATRVFEQSVHQLADEVGLRREAVTDLLRLSDFSDVEVTEDFTVNTQQLRSKLEALSKEKPWFFEAKKTSVPSATPFVADAASLKTKKLEDLSLEEIKALAKQIKE